MNNTTHYLNLLSELDMRLGAIHNGLKALEADDTYKTLSQAAETLRLQVLGYMHRYQQDITASKVKTVMSSFGIGHQTEVIAYARDYAINHPSDVGVVEYNGYKFSFRKTYDIGTDSRILTLSLSTDIR